MGLIFVDVEGGQAPGHGRMTEFGMVDFASRRTFHGHDDQKFTAENALLWLRDVSPKGRPIFVSDNPAYDWQWMNEMFWRELGMNPFGHSARRISDYYAGLVGDFYKTQEWKAWRVTPHDHNPVHDAQGNAEAFATMQERARLGTLRPS